MDYSIESQIFLPWVYASSSTGCLSTLPSIDADLHSNSKAGDLSYIWFMWRPWHSYLNPSTFSTNCEDFEIILRILLSEQILLSSQSQLFRPRRDY